MTVSGSQRKAALAAQAREELDALEARGVWMAGNGYSSVVLVKGELNEGERAGAELLSGRDGDGLRAALSRQGFAPEDFCGLAAVPSPGSEPTADAARGGDGVLPVELFREALEALDPEAVILLDTTAIGLMREAYADALAAIEDFDTAMLTPGRIAPVLGRRVLPLDGFEAALGNPEDKRRMWHYLQRLKPAAAPY